MASFPIRRRSPGYDLAGKTVLVTGAGGGIGSATTRALIGAGANVTLVDLTQDTVDAVASGLPAERVLPMAGDVTSTDDMTAAVNDTVATFGRLDVVFANAGIVNDPLITLATADLAAYEKVIEVDLLGVVRTIKPALPEIIKNSGYVLVTASLYSFMNGAVNSAYAAAKAGVEMLGRSLRAELAIHGASAGVLYPGWVATPIVRATQDDELVRQLHARAFPGPLGQFTEPEQIAHAVVAGIRRRAPRIVEQKRWAPVSTFRGVLNPVIDRWIERDATLRGLMTRLEQERTDV